MKFGPRTPSLTKSIAARTSAKRFVAHSLGVKAPRGMGWITNPKKAAYNRVYNRSTFSLGKGGNGLAVLLLFGLVILAFNLLSMILSAIFKEKEIQDDVTNCSLNSEASDPSNNIIPLCPRCSSSMIARTAKRGRNIGNKFWGCTRFPRCRGTRDAA